MAIYQRQGEKDGSYDTGDTLADMLWNRDLDASKTAAFGSASNLQEVLNDFANNYPSFKATMQKEGLLNADGTVNSKKFIDKGYLEDLKARYDEGINNQSQAMIRSNAFNQARGTGTTANSAMLGKSINDSQRNMLRDYASANKGERENAYSKAMTTGKQAQSDAMGKAQAGISSAQNEYATNAQIAQSQSRGLFQDPETYKAIGGMAAGALTGGASTALGGLGTTLQHAIGNNSYGEKMDATKFNVANLPSGKMEQYNYTGFDPIKDVKESDGKIKPGQDGWAWQQSLINMYDRNPTGKDVPQWYKTMKGIK